MYVCTNCQISMMCTNDVIFFICMLCDKFVILHKFVEEKVYGAYVKWLLYSTVNKSSMSMSRIG